MNNDNVIESIKSVVTYLMDRVMERVLVTDPFCVDKHHAESRSMLHLCQMKFSKDHISNVDSSLHLVMLGRNWQ